MDLDKVYLFELSIELGRGTYIDPQQSGELGQVCLVQNKGVTGIEQRGRQGRMSRFAGVFNLLPLGDGIEQRLGLL
ncbi:hypothetical protein AMS64_18470 [Aeromonas veronii]|nr:hypothetical protein AMS64_18470 [Aeromonas veronii]